MTKEKGAVKRRNLIPVTKWNEYHVFPTLGTLRALIFNAKKNGFDQVIRRVNSRILIDEDAYFNWVDMSNGIKKEEN